MWLDRLTATSSTAFNPPSRPQSPFPKRSTLLPPGHRSSLGVASNRPSLSLDVSANTSAVSLVSTAPHTNGSSLKYEQKPPEDLADPIVVLHSFLGLSEESARNGTQIGGSNREEVEEEIDFKDFSLEEFAEQEPAYPYAYTAASFSLPSEPSVRQKYEDFHTSLVECDDVLQSVETYLTNFQAELGQVSAEIENLQARSIQLNAKLDNRRKVEKLLGPSVEEISLQPNAVKAIADGPIDDAFVQALKDVDAKSALIAERKKSSSATTSKALQDLIPLLNDLKERAVERIRDYLVAQIRALRSPNINAQVIQLQSFIKYKALFPFLARNHPVLGEEIGQAYINTMKWYYSSHFNRYQQALSKIHVHVFDQQDLLGSDPTAAPKRNVLGGNKVPTTQHDAFGIGKRSDIVNVKVDSALPAHLAEDNKAVHYLEVPFRHFNQALIDNITAEYSIATELFSTYTFQQLSRKCTEIFEPTFTLGHNFTKQLVENTSDCLGLLLCVRVNQRFAFELQRRKVPIADSYINYTNILLWPRFQIVMDMHCESLRKVPVSTNRGGAAAAAAFSLIGSSSSSDSSKISLAPHYITQRFGQFLHGILTLSADAGDDEPVSNSLIRLRNEYESLMAKLAKGVGIGVGSSDAANKRNKFLSNNYSLVQTIISDCRGKLAEEQMEHFTASIKELKIR